MNKTYRLKKQEITSSWHLIDATDKTLGRLATEISKLLLGKHKPTFEPHLVMGDYVIIINSDKVAVTGQKKEKKIYYRHSGYPGGIRSRTFAEQMQLDSRKVIEDAVKGMLPHNSKGRNLFRMLKVYANENHPHASQLFSGVQNNKNSKKIPKTLKRISNELQDSIVKENKNDFSKMTKPELIEEAEKLNLKFVKSSKKADILALIEDALK